MLGSAVSMVCTGCHATPVDAELVLGATSRTSLLPDDYLG